MKYKKGLVNGYESAGVIYLTEQNYRLYQLTEELNDGFYFAAWLTIKDDLLSNGKRYYKDGLRRLHPEIVATFGWRDRLTDEMQYIDMTASQAFDPEARLPAFCRDPQRCAGFLEIPQ